MKKSEQIKIWKKYYASDQDNLYKNVFIRLLFDLGHKYIAKNGASIRGRILDIGSGMGYHLKFEKLSAKREYLCLDNDPKMLEFIKRAHTKKIVGTCSRIPLKNDSMNAVIASHILEHLPNLKKDLIEIKRVLKSDGKFLVVLPCDPGLLWRLLTFITPSRWRLKRLGIDYDVVMKHEHVNTYEKCINELEKEFQITNKRFYPFFIKNYNCNILCCMTLLPK